MQQQIAYTKKANQQKALKDICSQLHRTTKSYDLLIFMASSIYDFDALTAEFHRLFPETQVVGVSSGGEITYDGFSTRGLLVTTMTDEDTTITPLLMDWINKYPITQKADVESALYNCGINLNEPDFHEHCFALSFINGLLDLEEQFLSMFYSIIGNRNFKLLGASAGDDHNFCHTAVSLNGIVSTTGAVIIFINTNKRFKLYKKNFYKPTGKQLHISDCDMKSRLIREINGKPPLTAYAEELGVSATTLVTSLLDHPLGRTYGKDTYITSLKGFNDDKALNMRTRIIKNSYLDILEPEDALEETEKLLQEIKKDFDHPGFLLFFICICDVISIEQKGLCDKLTALHNKYFSQFCGLASAGEQFNQMHLSQTTLVLAMEE